MNPSPRRRVLINALFAATQAVVTGATLLFLSRYLLHFFTQNQLGFWTTLTSYFTLARIADFGLVGGIVKFTAESFGKGDRSNALSFLSTGITTICFLTTIPALLLIVLVCVLVNVPGHIPWFRGYQYEWHALWPGLALSAGLTAMANSFQAGLDACQRVDLRKIILIVQSVLFFVVAWKFVPWYGLMGIVAAQALSLAVALILSAWALGRLLSDGEKLKWRVSLPHLRTMLRYGMSYQVATICSLIFDPLVKNLLKIIGGEFALAYSFELASRMATQVRSLFVSALESLVPFVASLQHKAGATFDTYKESFDLTLIFSTGAFGCALAGNVLVSYFVFRGFERDFIIYSCLLTFGWWFNGLCVPAYFAAQGHGMQRWNAVAHIVMTVLNALLSVVLGQWWQGVGVVFGFVLSLCVGCVIIVVGFHRIHAVKLSDLFSSSKLAYLGGVALLSIIPLALFYSQIHIPTVVLLGISLVIILAITALTFSQPQFRFVFEKSKALVFNRKQD